MIILLLKIIGQFILAIGYLSAAAAALLLATGMLYLLYISFQI